MKRTRGSIAMGACMVVATAVALTRPVGHAQPAPRARTGASIANRRPPRADTRAPTANVLVMNDADRARATALYERMCAGCHGVRGQGDGPLARYLGVRPRDFVRGAYKWRSTPSGTRPTIEDVARTIARGVPGGFMPAFGGALPSADRTLLARFVLTLDALARPPGTPLAAAQIAPQASAEIRSRGAAIYDRLQCAACHGPALRGDGPQAATQDPRPYDLTRNPARGGADARSIARALRTGIDGTSMPSYGDALSPADLEALAHFVASIIPPDVAALRAGSDPGESQWLGESARPFDVPPPTRLDDDARIARESHYWDFPLAPQGAGPAHFGPAERSLHPDQCARCHARQFEQFRTSIHASAMSPGIVGQLVDAPAAEVAQCQTCHAPLAEQVPGAAADHDPALRAQGIVCAACHLRGRERFGAPSRVDAHGSTQPSRLPAVGYPITRLQRFERGDFCAPCHQHQPHESVGGRPVLNTVVEWIDSPYFARGVQCQHCHMPDRDHTWRGAHDPDAVRQAVRVTASARRDGPSATAEVRIENIGAGHAFPGTTTPSAVLEIQWLDAQGRAIGAPARDIVQRHLEWDGRAWHERFDTRILPGRSRTVTSTVRDANARSFRYTFTFRPDDYYEGLYRRAVGESFRSVRARQMLTTALDRAARSPFVVRTDIVALP